MYHNIYICMHMWLVTISYQIIMRPNEGIAVTDMCQGAF